MKIGAKEAQRRALREQQFKPRHTEHEPVAVIEEPSAQRRKPGRPRLALSDEDRVTLKREQTKARVAAYRARQTI